MTDTKISFIFSIQMHNAWFFNCTRCTLIGTCQCRFPYTNPNPPVSLVKFHRNECECDTKADFTGSTLNLLRDNSTIACRSTIKHKRGICWKISIRTLAYTLYYGKFIWSSFKPRYRYRSLHAHKCHFLSMRTTTTGDQHCYYALELGN